MNNFKKVLLVTFTGMLFLNVPVYALEGTVINEQTQAEITTNTNEETEANSITDVATEQQTENDEEQVDAGIAPDSALYVLDRLLEELQISLTFNDVNRAAILTTISEERLAEVNYLIEKAENEKVDQEEWNQLINEVVNDFKEKMEEAIESVDNVSVELSNEEKAKLNEIAEKIENSTNLDEEIIEDDVKEVIEKAIMVASVVRDLDQEKVKEIREQGLGLGEISQIFSLAEAADIDVDDVTKLYVEDGLGFGDAAKALGLHPSEIAKQKVDEKKTKKKKDKNKAIVEANVEVAVDDIKEDENKKLTITGDSEVSNEQDDIIVADDNGTEQQIGNKAEEKSLKVEQKAEEKVQKTEKKAERKQKGKNN